MKQPFTSADPDGPAYDAMIADSKKRQARGDAAQYGRIGDTADKTDKVLTAYEKTPQIVGGLVQDEELLRFGRRFGKASGPVGKVLSAISADAEFRADRASGMPLDVALIKHGGGFVAGIVGGAAGAVAFKNPAAVAAGSAGLGAFGTAAMTPLSQTYEILTRGNTAAQKELAAQTSPLAIIKRRAQGLPPIRPSY